MAEREQESFEARLNRVTNTINTEIPTQLDDIREDLESILTLQNFLSKTVDDNSQDKVQKPEEAILNLLKNRLKTVNSIKSNLEEAFQRLRQLEEDERTQLHSTIEKQQQTIVELSSAKRSLEDRCHSLINLVESTIEQNRALVLCCGFKVARSSTVVNQPSSSQSGPPSTSS